MYPHQSLGVGVGGVGVGVGGGAGVGVEVQVCINITTPKYLLNAKYNILYRVCIECTPITHWEWVWGVWVWGVWVWAEVGVWGCRCECAGVHQHHYTKILTLC